MISKDTPVTLVISGSNKVFTSEDRLKSFFDERQGFWELFDFKGLQNPLNSAETIVTRDSDFRRAWTPYTTDQNQTSLQSRLQAELSKLPAHTDSDAQIIRQIYDEHGREIAAGAVLTLAGFNSNLNSQHREMLAGAVAFNIYRTGLAKTGLKAHKNALAALQENHDKQFNAHLLKAEELHGSNESLQERAAVAIENQAQWTRLNHDELVEQTSEKVADKIAELDAREEAYREAMKLDRPRQYWSKKAFGHRKKSNTYRWRMFAALGLSGVLAVCGLATLFCVSLHLIVSNPATKWPVTLFLLLGGMGFVGVSILFWINRLIVRLFLSELHLAMDAEERVTMIESYLALNAEVDFPSEQRDIILQAIFRPTQDGIVKDDAAADPNLTAVLGRLKV